MLRTLVGTMAPCNLRLTGDKLKYAPLAAEHLLNKHNSRGGCDADGDHNQVGIGR